jgi:hypothetical protein
MRYSNVRYFISFMFCLLLAGKASSQKNTLWRESGKWSAWGVRLQTQTFLVSENKLDTCNCSEEDRNLYEKGNVGMLVSYYKSTGHRFAYSLNLGLSFGRVGTKEEPTLLAESKVFGSVRGDLYYHVGKERQMIMPYLHTGLHAQLGSVYASLPVGAGIRWMMRNSPVFITSQLDYGFGFTSNLRNNLIGSLGVYVNLGADRKQSQKKYQPDNSPCLDGDSDGVPDGTDKCPFMPGSMQNKGCPVCDTDGDGIVDDKDKCPTIPGSMPNEGCPVLDTDEDGLVDSKDNCPTVPGPISNLGCPLVDTDGDGIGDDKDDCPSVAGVVSNHGCPTSNIIGGKGSKSIENNNLDELPEAIVYFALDKYNLSTEALSTIQKAAIFMRSHPAYKLVLSGHTDKRASAAYNLKLSKNRVLEVRNELVRQGVEASRISYDYYGKQKLTIDQEDESSHSKNRRVEFIFLRQ